MNGCLGMVDLLMDTSLTPQQEHYCKRIRQSGDALLHILNSVLDISKIEAGQLSLMQDDFNLADVIDTVSATFESRCWQKGLQYTVDVDADVPEVLLGDSDCIRQVLSNYVGNAIKFTEEGKISVRVFPTAVSSSVCEIRFEVADTGKGLTREEQPRLFKKFSQVDGSISRKYGGSGLGLAISKQLAEAMGGQVGVESTPGEGATFWFSVQCAVGNLTAADDETFERRDTGGAWQATKQSLRILVAEDNEINQEIVKAVLHREGHLADVVNNGLEAVKAVKGTDYDLILMDVHMPEMDGLMATRTIRELSGDVSRIPIVALTADAMSGDRERYLKAGMNEYLCKPFERHQLNAIIQKVAPYSEMRDKRRAA